MPRLQRSAHLLSRHRERRGGNVAWKYPRSEHSAYARMAPEGPVGGGLLVFCVADTILRIQRDGAGVRQHGDAESALWKEMSTAQPWSRRRSSDVGSLLGIS